MEFFANKLGPISKISGAATPVAPVNAQARPDTAPSASHDQARAAPAPQQRPQPQPAPAAAASPLPEPKKKKGWF